MKLSVSLRLFHENCPQRVEPNPAPILREGIVRADSRRLHCSSCDVVIVLATGSERMESDAAPSADA